MWQDRVSNPEPLARVRRATDRATRPGCDYDSFTMLLQLWPFEYTFNYTRVRILLQHINGWEESVPICFDHDSFHLRHYLQLQVTSKSTTSCNNPTDFGNPCKT